MRAVGIPSSRCVHHAFDNFHLLYRAAASGLGTALGVDVIVKPCLEDAQPVRPFNTWRRLTKGYYIVPKFRLDSAPGLHVARMADDGSPEPRSAARYNRALAAACERPASETLHNSGFMRCSNESTLSLTPP